MQKCKQFFPLLLYIQEIKISMWSLTLKVLPIYHVTWKNLGSFFCSDHSLPAISYFDGTVIVFILFTIRRVSLLSWSHGRVFLWFFWFEFRVFYPPFFKWNFNSIGISSREEQSKQGMNLLRKGLWLYEAPYVFMPGKKFHLTPSILKILIFNLNNQN